MIDQKCMQVNCFGRPKLFYPNFPTGPIYTGMPAGAVYRPIYPANSGTPPQIYTGAQPLNAPLSIPYVSLPLNTNTQA